MQHQHLDEQEPSDSIVLYSIGHSTHSATEFIELLRSVSIALLVDVRSFPGSRRWPQFNQRELGEALKSRNIEYCWLQELGGRRHHIDSNSPHRAWQHPSFKAYADYSESGQFRAGLAKLIQGAEKSRSAYMCSEGLWWKCHRRIISDRLVVAGCRVLHIMPDGKLTPHQLPDFARVEDGHLLYDAG